MGLLLAHGVGARGDLPVDPSFLAWGGGLVLLVSFAAFGVLWTTPRLSAAARRSVPLWSPGTTASGWVSALGSMLGLALYGLTVSAAFFGSPIAALNPVPWIVYIAVWTAMPLAAFLFGDVWRWISPFRPIASVLAGMRRSSAGADDQQVGAWPAAVALVGFAWVELAYHSPSSPRVLGWLIIAYTLWATVPVLWLGRAWTESADGLGWWFSKVAAMSVWVRRDDRRRGVRAPTAGLAQLETSVAASISILVVLGAASFDGLSRTDLWNDIGGGAFGWRSTAINTVGLGLTAGLVGIVYWIAARYFDRGTSTTSAAFSAFGPSLVPIAFGYGIAHYFSLLVFEGQTLMIRLSDPFFTGADWFGTAGRVEDYTAVSPTTIAWVQVLSIIGGHIVAVMVAHDRALEIEPDSEKALRAQYATIAAMVVYTAAGLLLLVNA